MSSELSLQRREALMLCDCLAEDDFPVFIEEMDDAIIGVVENATGDMVTAYSKRKMLQILRDQGMVDKFEAEEYFEYNIEGLVFKHNRTPIYIEEIWSKK